MDNEYYFKLTDEGGTPAPSGEIVITANGTYDVTEKASAVVNVASRLIELKQSHIKSIEIEVS